MATCPQCYGPLSDRHRCRGRRVGSSLWRGAMAFVGAGCLGMVSLAVWPEVIPGIAVAAGGALGYAGGRLIRDG